MAISPPSDLILDVARAVDPLSYSQAAQKLAQTGPGATASGPEFAQVFEEIGPPPEPFVPVDPATILTQLRNRDALAGRAGGPNGGPYQQFEAFVLQSFVQSMLPQSSTELFGKGTSGEIWRSMLAEQIGAQLAKAGGIGLAERLAAADPARHPEPS